MLATVVISIKIKHRETDIASNGLNSPLCPGFSVSLIGWENPLPPHTLIPVPLGIGVEILGRGEYGLDYQAERPPPPPALLTTHPRPLRGPGALPRLAQKPFSVVATPKILTGFPLTYKLVSCSFKGPHCPGFPRI